MLIEGLVTMQVALTDSSKIIEVSRPGRTSRSRRQPITLVSKSRDSVTKSLTSCVCKKKIEIS